jgi:hypothetical protein
MRVRMKTDVSGARDGEPWPPRGGTIELPDDEAAQLCASGMAEPVAEHKAAEKAVPADDAEKRDSTSKSSEVSSATAESAEDKTSGKTPEKATAKASEKSETKPGPGRPRSTKS